MHVAIFTGGKHAPSEVILVALKKNPPDYFIAADAGLETAAALNIPLNYIVGDFDSLNDKSLIGYYPNVEVARFPIDKDYTDTELALCQAEKVLARQAKKEITIFGAGGADRLDHLVYFLRIFKTDLPPAHWVFDTGEGFCLGELCPKTLELSLPVGTIVSVFALSRDAKILSEGLHWSLDVLDWDKAASVSNRTDTGSIRLTVLRGRFLVFVIAGTVQ